MAGDQAKSLEIFGRKETVAEIEKSREMNLF
jgi:hypothetical protein